MSKTNKSTQTTQSTETKSYDSFTTKSAKIRAMAADGMSRGAIAKQLGIRYQHVRNVLVNPLKKTA